MIPGKAHREDVPSSSEGDQTRSDGDQTGADGDQTASDRDQSAADLDQLAANEDQAASDVGLAHGLDREVYDHGREVRDRTSVARIKTARERYDTAQLRDATARERDLAALVRDRAAEERDLEADERDVEIARLTATFGTEKAKSGHQVVLRAARERQRAAHDRARAAGHRGQASRDRDQAAHDRLLAARDRVQAQAERREDAVDALTGAWRRGPGLVKLEDEIERVRGETGQLVLAYVDIDGLKAVNDVHGHRAGDLLLKRVVGALREHFRSSELVIRLGGDEFVCAVTGASAWDVQRRFSELVSELNASAEGGSITVGLAELAPADSAMDLVERADDELLGARGAGGLANKPRRDGPGPQPGRSAAGTAYLT